MKLFWRVSSTPVRLVVVCVFTFVITASLMYPPAVFTPEQGAKFREMLQARDMNGTTSDAESISSYNPDADIEDGDEQDEAHDFHTPSSATAASPRSEHADTAVSDMEDLAREFGIEAHLVQALAQRLAGAGLR